MSQPKILALAGSTRQGSWNKKLVRVAAKSAEQAGAMVTLIDLRDFPLPLYDGDDEAAQGIPQPATDLKKLFVHHGGLLISAPEYNSSITAVLKNAIDWVSRPVEGEPSLVAFRGKVAGLLSASPGALGGLRGLVHVRSILGNIGVLVLPDQFALVKANEAFDGDGNLKDAKSHSIVDGLARRLCSTVAKLERNPD
jgi:NAD(P)H-dependent FMN reductase